MQTNLKSELETALVSVAAEGLVLARSRGVTEVSGIDALIAAMAVRRPRLYGKNLMTSDEESATYFNNLGEIVNEKANELQIVDPQG